MEVELSEELLLQAEISLEEDNQVQAAVQYLNETAEPGEEAP